MGVRRRGGGVTIIIALLMAVGALFRYFSSSTVNPVTGEKQRVAGITTQQEIALGLQSAPTMAQQHGGLSRDERATSLVKQVGQKIVQSSAASKSDYRFDFHLLADRKTVNAFALPGGQIFITEALLKNFTTEGQLAGVLGHEIGHVIGRHSAEQIAKQQLTQGLTGAAALASYDPNNPSSRNSAAVVAAVGQLVNMKYGRSDELESDKFGVELIAQAGYDPRAMIKVMQVLKAAGGGGRQPEFFSTHPNPENRVGQIEKEIKRVYPNGVPAGMTP